MARIRKILVLLFVAGLFLLPFFANRAFAQDTPGQEPAKVYFFSSAICPHCAAEREFLDGLKSKYPEIEIVEYEVVYHPENKEVLKEFQDKYNVPQEQRVYVPETFTPAKYFIGFNDQIANEIESCL